jgi:hypothetical protein
MLRVGRPSGATRQFVLVQLGRPQVQGGLGQQGRPNVHINVLSSSGR